MYITVSTVLLFRYGKNTVMKLFELITDSNFFLLGPVSLGLALLLQYWYTGGMRIRWLVHTVENKAYLREYNMGGVRWWMYSCYCT
jgi:hypothetical protein